MDFPSRLKYKLSERERQLTLRSLSLLNPSLKSLASNDFLQFSKLHFPASKLPSGSTGARLISGNHPIFHRLEKQILPQFHQSKAALYFNSGYAANLGLLSAISLKGDTILYDAKVHASIRDGMRLGFAHQFSFAHNNIEDLTQKLHRAHGNVYVVVESVYSMDGDIAPLKEILSICQQFNAYLIVDEAHALGVFGSGLCLHLGIENQVFARIFTYGKALGLHGASVCGSEELIQYLINFSRPFIYTTAASPAEIERLIEHILFFNSPEGLQKQKDLHTLILLFNSKAKELAMIPNDTAIQFFRCASLNQALSLERSFEENGYFVKSIKSPTVPEGEEGIRIALNVGLNEQDIIAIIEILKNV